MNNPLCTSMCHGSQRDRMPDAEASVKTATPGGPIAFRSHATARACRLLLWWSRLSSSSHHRHMPTCTHCCSAVMTPSTHVRHTVATSRCFGRCWWRIASPHRRQAGTSNLLMHDDARETKAAGSIGSVMN
jgi:hypothetical protein